MDSISNSLNLSELGFSLQRDLKDKNWGTLSFNYNGREVKISSLNLIEFSRLMRSAVYAATLYGVCGPSYVEDTDVSIGFFECLDGLASINILEGSHVLFNKNLNLVPACREVGLISLWAAKVTCRGNYLKEIECPEIYFNLGNAELDELFCLLQEGRDK
jgi:hypothetical protein